jgi:hypothetical protein
MPFAQLESPGGAGAAESLWILGLRLAGALVLGWLAADIYRRTCDRSAPASFRVTLVLLTVLIAAVTQVIGDSVARAFSLVGALSIVRFRTVVQDTRDTAFVIFAVTLGMAVGAGDYRVAGAALVAVAIGAFATAVAFRDPAAPVEDGRLRLTVAAGSRHSLDTLLAPVLSKFAARSEFVQMSTQKGGASISGTYDVWLQAGVNPAQVVEALNTTEGIQSALLAR